MVEAVTVKLLCPTLKTRMGTIEILSYAFTLEQTERILSRLSRRSRIFFEKNRNDIRFLCVNVRSSPFWGRTKCQYSGDNLITWPTQIAKKNKQF
jgi:hypothetical protein